MISLSQCRRYPTREWNRASPEYRLEALLFGLLAVVESCKTCVRVCNSPRLPTNNRLDQRFLAVPIIKFSPDAFLPSFNCASSWVQQRIKEREYSSARNLDQEWRKSKKCVCVCVYACVCVRAYIPVTFGKTSQPLGPRPAVWQLLLYGETIVFFTKRITLST